MVGDSQLYKELKINMNPITVHTLAQWFKVLKKYNDAEIEE